MGFNNALMRFDTEFLVWTVSTVYIALGGVAVGASMASNNGYIIGQSNSNGVFYEWSVPLIGVVGGASFVRTLGTGPISNFNDGARCPNATAL